MPTTPTQIRLTDEDLAKLKAICKHFALTTNAAAMRFAIEAVFRDLPPKAKKSVKGS